MTFGPESLGSGITWPPLPRVIVLIATVPSRRRSCERLLSELTRQSREPDGVVMVWDGFVDDVPVVDPNQWLPLLGYEHNKKPRGAGARWLLVEKFLTSPCDREDLRPVRHDDIVVCLDDDIILFEAPDLIAKLVEAVDLGGGAAAAMGRGVDNKSAPPGKYSRGYLTHAAGCGFAVRAYHLMGLQEFAVDVLASGGPDALGLHGDDDALVSAYLWKTRVNILHAATGNIYSAPGTQALSQTKACIARGESLDSQKLAIKKVTGWPWSLTVRKING